MSKRSNLSFKEAALQILKEAGEPLGYKEITAEAIEQGLLHPDGKTPEATMGAQLYLDIKNNKKTEFKKVGKGTFALKNQTESVASPLLLIENQNKKVREALLSTLLEMDPYQFEYLVADLLQAIGYEDVEVTNRSGDKGIDITANLTLEGVTNVKTIIQVKRYKVGNNIPGATITQLRGSAEVDQRGLVITTSDFTKGAIEESKAKNKMPVSLINGEKLLSFLMKHGVGVKKEQLEVYSLNTDYFDGEDTDYPRVQASSEKSKGLWPMPGGTTAYVETLTRFLSAVDEGMNTRKKLVQWFIDTFEAVNSAKTSYGYVNVPKNMGLIQIVDGNVSLTDAGRTFLEDQNSEFLFNTISENVLAFSDIVEFLANESEPQSQLMIRDYLNENFDVNWTTNAQVNFRITWLLNLGKIQKVDSGFVAQSNSR